MNVPRFRVDILNSLVSTVSALSEAAGVVADTVPDVEDDEMRVPLLEAAPALGEAAAPTADAVPVAGQALTA